MRRDFALYELSDDEFEALVVRICAIWLGEGVTPFSMGRDGGRDGKFYGKANCFPSAVSPLEGHVVLQAKHVNAPEKSYSDKDFAKSFKDELVRIKGLVESGICDHYILFSNRKLTGGADAKLIPQICKLGVKTAHIIGVEKLHLALESHDGIRNSLPNRLDVSPFHFEPNDLAEVIEALHDYAADDHDGAYQSAIDFEKLKIQEKNNINGLSAEFYQQIIVDRVDRQHQWHRFEVVN